MDASKVLGQPKLHLESPSGSPRTRNQDTLTIQKVSRSRSKSDVDEDS
jgi:hypothetical protein